MSWIHTLRCNLSTAKKDLLEITGSIQFSGVKFSVLLQIYDVTVILHERFFLENSHKNFFEMNKATKVCISSKGDYWKKKSKLCCNKSFRHVNSEIINFNTHECSAFLVRCLLGTEKQRWTQLRAWHKIPELYCSFKLVTYIYWKCFS